MSNQQHVIDTLEELIRICHDGEEGYGEGAEHAKSVELKKVLKEISQERAKFAADLERLGERWDKTQVERHRTAGGATQPGWMDLKTSLGGSDDAILSSMESLDDYARKHYDEAITDSEMPDEVTGVLRNQAQAIVGSLDRVRAMRRRREAA